MNHKRYCGYIAVDRDISKSYYSVNSNGEQFISSSTYLLVSLFMNSFSKIPVFSSLILCKLIPPRNLNRSIVYYFSPKKKKIKIQGIIIRAKVSLNVEGERSKNFFCNLEKKTI